MRIDKDKFYTCTCKKCVKYDNCYGGTIISCARLKMFNPEEFEKYMKKIVLEGEEYDGF